MFIKKIAIQHEHKERLTMNNECAIFRQMRQKNIFCLKGAFLELTRVIYRIIEVPAETKLLSEKGGLIP